MSAAKGSRAFQWGRFLRLTAAALVGIIIALLLASLVLSALYVTRITEAECSDWQWAPQEFGLSKPREVSFVAADGVELRGWYLPGSNQAAIILIGGIGTRRGMLPEAALLAQHGYGLLLFDWRGCGASGAALHTLGYGETLDVMAAAGYLRDQAGISRVGVLGFSVGGAAAIKAAAGDRDIDAVVAMGNYYDLEADIYGKGDEHPIIAAVFETEIAWLFQSKTGVDFDRDLEPVDSVPLISPRPLLLIHGELEENSPPANGQILFHAAREPKELWIVPGAGHGGYYQAQPEEFAHRVVSFFDAALLP